MKENTIIAEYLGDVITTEEYEQKFEEGTIKEWGRNSRFTLLETDSKNSSLEIIPEYNSNIARFLNSANFDIDDKDIRSFKNNVSVFRTSFNGKVVAIMHTNRRVKEKEEL